MREVWCMDRIKIMEARRKLGEYRVTIDKVLHTFNKYKNFPQEAKDELTNNKTRLQEAIEILDAELNK